MVIMWRGKIKSICKVPDTTDIFRKKKKPITFMTQHTILAKQQKAWLTIRITLQVKTTIKGRQHLTLEGGPVV